MRASSARRRAATSAVSTGRPMPGSSGTGGQAPSGGGPGLGRPCAASAGTATQAAKMSDRMGSEAIARAHARQLDAASAGDANYAMTLPSALEARVAELQRERIHLLAIIETLKEVSTSTHLIHILEAIARTPYEALSLDR